MDLIAFLINFDQVQNPFRQVNLFAIGFLLYAAAYAAAANSSCGGGIDGDNDGRMIHQPCAGGTLTANVGFVVVVFSLYMITFEKYRKASKL